MQHGLTGRNPKAERLVQSREERALICDNLLSIFIMTHDQEQIIIDLIEADIRKHSIKTINPTVQAWADGRVDDVKETLEAFRRILRDNNQAH